MTTRRTLLQRAAALVVAPGMGLRAGAAPLPELRLSGPSASVSNPLIHLAAQAKAPGLAEHIVFKPWRDPDQLRALAMRAEADFVAMPTNVAANMYNRGVPLKLVNVSVWGILYLVSRDAGRKTLADYRGEEIAMPFREDMPDLVFQETAQGLGLNPREDFKLRYVASPLDAMQLLITRRVRHALLAEPAVSMALRKTQSFPVSAVAPELHRAVNLQLEWARAFKRSSRIAQAGIVALGKAAQDPALISRFQEAYAGAAGWCQSNRAACGAEVAAVEPRLTAEAVADSLAHAELNAVPAAQAREEVQFLFERLYRRNPQLLGGKLPDAGFFAGA
ncbi:ABC transporter substrate-binding protein [Ottowia thiooxydans]|uniref:ABC transporter substrate-binding protein n=1 Tax=Ottowia thiooxydans TaxID=219182 RepID=UPI00040E969F|nr:ABC transporter substrate-binding protein [Ottowia thiooxydans]